ncbi:hypothetical protein FPV67DRAFT_1672901 [Lyophyllum atratum]|nr:hypothetical protein FPV67DRAFT_1672901 [Lyophyllum atratum]
MVGPIATQVIADRTGYSKAWGTHIITLYVWLLAGTANSAMAHTGYRSRWNDPGPHDEHHEYAFGQNSVNFGTAGVWDHVFGTKSYKSFEGAIKWEAQRDQQAALIVASQRSGISLTKKQNLVMEQPATHYEWADPRIVD